MKKEPSKTGKSKDSKKKARSPEKTKAKEDGSKWQEFLRRHSKAEENKS